MLLYRLAFVSALALTGAAVLWRGGKWERLAFIMLAADFVASPLLQVRSSWLDPQLTEFAVDVAFLAGLVWVAHRGQTWTLSATAAIQGLYIVLYLPFWLFPHRMFRAFYLAGNTLGYAEEGILIAGCLVPSAPRLAIRRGPSAERG